MNSPFLDLPLRTEKEVRESRVDNLVSMIEVIARGAAQAAWASKCLGCPSCGADPQPPAKILGRYVMECENDACVATFHVAGDSPADAVAKWNRRAP